MAKINDVAKLAGVSPASVSRFLNNRKLLRDETAEKIERAIAELDYSPNPIAVGLRTKHTRMIAFIIPTMNYLYYIELFNDIYQLCVECGYTPCLYSVEDDLEQLKKVLNELSEFQYEGVIISYLDEPEVIEALENLKKRMPVVLISADAQKNFDTVYLDVRKSTYDATKFYINNGIKHIALIAGGYVDQMRIIVKEKILGYQDAMIEAGLIPNVSIQRGSIGSQNIIAEARQSGTNPQKDNNCIDITDGLTFGILGTQSLMQREYPPEVLICITDIIAVGAHRYLSENGYCIPNDVAVVGFSGNTITSIYDPSISTIIQPLAEISRAAVGLLLRRIKDPTCTYVRRSFHTSFHIDGRVPTQNKGGRQAK